MLGKDRKRDGHISASLETKRLFSSRSFLPRAERSVFASSSKRSESAEDLARRTAGSIGLTIPSAGEIKLALFPPLHDDDDEDDDEHPKMTSSQRRVWTGIAMTGLSALFLGAEYFVVSTNPAILAGAAGFGWSLVLGLVAVYFLNKGLRMWWK